MKVRDLIEALKKEDPNLDVVVSGYEGGFCDIRGLKHIKIRKNVHTEDYMGPHDEDEAGAPALFIMRSENPQI